MAGEGGGGLAGQLGTDARKIKIDTLFTVFF